MQDTALSQNLLTQADTVVIKVGTALVFDETARQARSAWIASLARDVVALQEQNKKVVIVSSGAIALGRMTMQETRPKSDMTIAEKQAMAAVGQQELTALWKDAFRTFGVPTAQILATRHDFKNGRLRNIGQKFRTAARKILPRLFSEVESPKANLSHTLEALLAKKAVPIVNENDATATDEIKFGDNDRLGALVARLVKAHAYVILSDIDGLYTGNPQKDPQARHIPVVARIDDDVRAMASGPVSAGSSGGMISKVQAAEIATAAGCATIICQGNPADGASPLTALQTGSRHTLFLPQEASSDRPGRRGAISLLHQTP